MIRASAIDHVTLAVSSIARSREYYERVFGASCKPRAGAPTTLVVETEHVHFFLSESKASPNFIQRQHLSLRVDSLQEAISTLNSLGITDYETGVVDFFEHDNYAWCEWKDPDGIRLECVEILTPTGT